MLPRVLWLIGGGLLALPLAAILTPQEAPLALKILVMALLLSRACARSGDWPPWPPSGPWSYR